MSLFYLESENVVHLPEEVQPDLLLLERVEEVVHKRVEFNGIHSSTEI